jgi:pSer/pThr/pTyr-binding forkhead associated (FHA) protein
MEIPETEIIVADEGEEILRKTVRPGDYIIGRDEECDVCVEADPMSRRHAHITINFDHALIEDLGSRNGTFINGKAVTVQTRLWPNQTIEIGSVTIKLRRVKSIGPPDASLAPTAATLKRLLPD